METGIQKLGEIQGLGVYYDQYQEDQKFLMGYKGRELKFVIGNTRDLSLYEIAINTYKENHDRENN